MNPPTAHFHTPVCWFTRCSLAYETTDRKLERELGAFGAISSVRIVLDRKGNSRGYGFVEFASEEGELLWLLPV